MDVFNLIKSHKEVYTNNIGHIRANMVKLMDALVIEMERYKYIANDPDTGPARISPHLAADMVNLQNIATIYWRSSYQFNRTDQNNSPQNMFVQNSLEICNRTYTSFIDSIGSVLAFINDTVFGDEEPAIFTERREYIKDVVNQTTEFKKCSSEYVYVLDKAHDDIVKISDKFLRAIPKEMSNLMRDLNIQELHSPLKQDQRSFEESMIAYYLAQKTKLQLATDLSGESLDVVKSRIENFFFHINVRLLVPFIIEVTKSRHLLINSYNELMVILARLNGYITSTDYRNLFYGFKIWTRTLVTLQNNIVEMYETSTGHETLGDSFVLTEQSAHDSLFTIIDEHISSFYEGVNAEVKVLSSEVELYHGDLTRSVGEVNALLILYLSEGALGKQFIR